MVADPATAAVPGQPTSVTARAGGQLAEVTWTAATPDDPTITGSTVTAAPADTPPVTVDPTARTATVTGLTNGTAYTFTIAETNPDGTSHPRTPQPLSLPARPPPPPAPWPPARPASFTAVQLVPPLGRRSRVSGSPAMPPTSACWRRPDS